MKLPCTLFSGLLAIAAAEDFLFYQDWPTNNYNEYNEAIRLGYSVKVATQAEWISMTTADFAKFKAIILGAPYYGSWTPTDGTLENATAIWGPAVQGNIIFGGFDNHWPRNQQVFDNSLNFVSTGQDRTGANKTGLYIMMNQYYDSVPGPTMAPLLSYFGHFEMRGALGCYDDIHIVAQAPALANVTDADLSNWGCSVHEAFSTYPRNGTDGFQALAIANNIAGIGNQEFGDGSNGIPYIISRGATPAKCGDGIFDPAFGEECDDGNTLHGDGCSPSCKCESGLPNGNGTCRPIPLNTTSSLPTATSTFTSTSSLDPTSTLVNSTSSISISVTSVSASASASATFSNSANATSSTLCFGYGCGYGYPPPATFTSSPSFASSSATPTSTASTIPCFGPGCPGGHGGPGWWPWGWPFGNHGGNGNGGHGGNGFGGNGNGGNGGNGVGGNGGSGSSGGGQAGNGGDGGDGFGGNGNGGNGGNGVGGNGGNGSGGYGVN